MSSSFFLTPPLLPAFVPVEPCRTILSIDRSEPRIESHTGSKIRKTWKKTMKISTLFVNFRLIMIRFKIVPSRSRKSGYSAFKKEGIISFNWKKILLPNFKGATKSYYMQYSCVVIVLFNTALCRSAFSTVSFRKLVFLSSQRQLSQGVL